MAVNFQHNARHVFVVQQNFCSSDFGEHVASAPCRGAEEDRTGVVIKADTVGGLEALAFELHQRNIPVRQATVGPVNKKDVRWRNQPLTRFSVSSGFFHQSQHKRCCSSQRRRQRSEIPLRLYIYHIMDAFEEWQEATKAAIEEEQREAVVYPGKVRYLKDHTFRAKGPAIVGMRPGGRIHVGQRLMKP